MALEDHPYLNRTDEPVAVSSRLLMIPAFLVVCLTVSGVLYALANTVAKPADAPEARPAAPVQRKVLERLQDADAHGARIAPTHASIRRHLPGEPAFVHHS